jgi:hypothetical protein
MIDTYGPICFGIVVGWMACRVFHEAKVTDVTWLASMFGVIGGGVIATLIQKRPDLFNSYSVGLAAAFFLRPTMKRLEPRWISFIDWAISLAKTSDVVYDPVDARPGRPLTISYKGALAGSPQVTMRWGINNWQVITDQKITDQKMTRKDGLWATTITIPMSAAVLHFAFTDGTNWDNNGNRNWNQNVKPAGDFALRSGDTKSP